VSDRDSILDIGCGKGSAMWAMCKFPFARIDGIEISPHIASIAAQNFATLKETRCQIFNCDAAVFREYHPYTMIYFYHPFPAEVMERVMANLELSLAQEEKEVLVIYNNPVCHSLIVERGVFFKMAEYPDEWGNQIYVYSNRPAMHSRISHLTLKAGRRA
jgi:tRNA1(Val) A37 N6-methylase TrmN6